MSAPLVCKVCVPHSNRDHFDYYSGGVLPAVGARVYVPFRQKTKLGVVVGYAPGNEMPLALKTIAAVIDETALLSDELLWLCQWVGEYYQSPLSEVLPLVLPKKYREGEPCRLSRCDCYALLTTDEEAHRQVAQHAHRRHALIDFMVQQITPVPKRTITQAGFTTTQVQALLDEKILVCTSHIEYPIVPSVLNSEPLVLNEEQAQAVEQISLSLSEYHGFLLQGITGSGKTEVYLQVIAKVLALGKQVLVLVPEIGLTPQLLARFTARFNQPIAVIHSHLNDSERQQAWQLANDNEVQLVIGTRTAVFTPMPKLGLIVIDEEHDASLKQMEGVRYSARDTALMRAHRNNIPIVLGSATPSLESLYNCKNNKYILLRLDQRALSVTPLHYQLIDVRGQPMQHGIAHPTLLLISEHLKQQNQVLVFINRRGFAPVLLCHQCGWMADCRACDTHLTLHRKNNRLICHHCGLNQAVIGQCPSCKSRELLPIGTGTQRVYDYLSAQFPHIAAVRVDRDEVQRKHALHACLQRIHEGEVQLIVGTQMLAKGHHFPRLTLVVVLDADNGFYNQDFRAIERLGQLLTQVAGRAGRAQYAGQVLVQTHLPQHPLLNLLVQEGYEPFAQALLNLRQQADLPPYHFLAMIRVQGNKQAKLLDFLHAIKAMLQPLPVTVMGPAPAPLARKAGQHRLQLLIKASSRKKLQAALTVMRDWLTINKLGNGIRWNVDVDPMDLS